MQNPKIETPSENTNFNWQLWCRLCAKEDPLSNANIIFKNDQKELRKNWSQCLYDYFGVQVDEALPKMLCTDCFSFVTSIITFSERVGRVQEMYQVLKNQRGEKNLDSYEIRAQFGFSEYEREHIFIPQNSVLEFNNLYSKQKEYNLEENSFEDEPIFTENTFSRHILKVKRMNEMTIDADIKSPPKKTRKQSINESRGNSRDDQGDDIQRGSNPTTNKGDDNNVKDSLSPLPSKEKLNHKNEVIFNSKRHIRSRNDEEKINNIEENKPILAKITRRKRVKEKETAYSCSECSKDFKHVQHFRQHMKGTHSISPTVGDWKCSHCPGRVFVTQYQLEAHHKTHLPLELKRTVPCSYCNKKFSSNSIVQNHIKYVHNNDRSFICEECGITMRTNAALKAHMLTHTDYAPFECEICKKGFKNQIRLKNHMETHDPHKHICAECGLQLNSRATLNRHLLVHSDLMIHSCDYCGRAFKRAKALKNHLILHTGLKPYSCDFCDKTFANGSNCRSHKKKSHPAELAALEAAGGAKQYTRNIPKLEALKAVTKAADNLAHVVSKQSGRFSFGKKMKPFLPASDANAKSFRSFCFESSSDTVPNSVDVSSFKSDAEIHKETCAPLSEAENISNLFFKQSTSAQNHIHISQQREALTTDSTYSDVGLNQRQSYFQSVQSPNGVISSLSVSTLDDMESIARSSGSRPVP